MEHHIISLKVTTPELTQTTNDYINKKSKFMKIHSDTIKVKFKNIEESIKQYNISEFTLCNKVLTQHT